ncbi:hypothetical protein [Streptomyces sp. Root1295]|uniref:hypothetical protein n=1 Tax=Streptomyces sp. Root1295 TaxID=1736448 RepID=UPI001F5295F7|nr:hypothetical protein [Streptomyces sp. Root1295]
MLVGKVTVVLDIVGELPESVGHVSVRVFVDVRPVDPDEVKHGVGPIGHGYSHSAKSPRAKLRSLNADANRISFPGRDTKIVQDRRALTNGQLRGETVAVWREVLAAIRGGKAVIEGWPAPFASGCRGVPVQVGPGGARLLAARIAPRARHPVRDV